MSGPNAPTDPPPATSREPIETPLVTLLREIVASSKEKTAAMGSIARELDAGIRSFSDAHGHRAAAESRIEGALKRIEDDQRILRHEVQSALKRLAPLELEVDNQRAEIQTARQDAQKASEDAATALARTTGNGHDPKA